MTKRKPITDADVALAYAVHAIRGAASVSPSVHFSLKWSSSAIIAATKTALDHGVIACSGSHANARLTPAGIALLDPDVAAQYRAAVARKVKIAS